MKAITFLGLVLRLKTVRVVPVLLCVVSWFGQGQLYLYLYCSVVWYKSCVQGHPGNEILYGGA